MKRLIINELKKWKASTNRKPVIIQGARQVGKTWVMKEFGETMYDKVVYVNFESSQLLQNLFHDDFDISRILTALEIVSKVKITTQDTLIIFDEIQEAHKGLTALKYFYENAPEYHIIAAGSLLGVSIQKNQTFPVGKVDFMNLYPLSFEEFLINLDEAVLCECVKSRQWSLLDMFHEKLVGFLRLYYL